jgi:phosphoglucosamine mutase
MINKKYFGTDGIRGTANKFPITPDIILKVGIAVGAKFINGLHRHRVVIGKDTRLSGYVIEPALTSGFAAVGMDVFLVGPVPTPAVSMLTKSLRADIGVMISASHNPYHDNGIKIFDRDGYKLDDQLELEVEALIEGDLTPYLAKPENCGRVKRIDDAKGRYIEFVKNSFPKDQTLAGLKIVVDCANGAAYSMAPTIFWELGAEVIEIGVEPDGFNINKDCGSTHPEKLCKEVIARNADIGIALDGDADRLLIVDEKGCVIDGDIIIGLIAKKLRDNGELRGGAVIATQMSNLSLENYIKSLGLNFIRANVGDRYVLEEMRKRKCNFGGEKSGHLVFSDYSTTGDGLIASLQLLSIITTCKKSVSEIVNIFSLTPQILKNITFSGSKKNSPLKNEEIAKFITKKQNELEKIARIFVRQSGTENLIRIMIEGDNKKLIEELAEEIADKINKSIALN